jgi:hypothetical protein
MSRWMTARKKNIENLSKLQKAKSESAQSMANLIVTCPPFVSEEFSNMSCPLFLAKYSQISYSLLVKLIFSLLQMLPPFPPQMGRNTGSQFSYSKRFSGTIKRDIQLCGQKIQNLVFASATPKNEPIPAKFPILSQTL